MTHISVKEKRKKDILFHFKQFSVRHDRSGMKVGTDGVLLGAWADVTLAKTILDIGTGTGIIALMLAQRANFAKIDAVEIDKDAFDDARENIESSPWVNRVKVHHCAIQDFKPSVNFDLIVSNPPYFQNSFKPPGAQRKLARHTQQLTFQNVVDVAQKFLSPAGRLNIILPYTEGLEFITMAEQHNFYCSRKWSFKTRPEKPVERWLLEFSLDKKLMQDGEIVLYKEGDIWSDNYQELTRNFYLKL